ncbi:pyruvate kinase alpha/beta domain-containing protein [Methanogenium organophilum]|uniref:Pyruvate kinase C-terminal domain-containing protein n=1 Tax=Methanogenium organophilum TaxID=2199 RepID=A0A9X9S429_METOG|nr:pyruvate kinase alpha/beta domain-containing protein [Methanogenium organophilum]WAI01604.1 hypothetical protein OU421_01675 [Methanogenium organophilum]
MSFSEKSVFFFDRPGKENSHDAAKIAVKRAQELGISTIVVASTTGETAKVFAEAMEGTDIHLVCVTHTVGFREPGVWEFDEANLPYFKEQGADVIMGTHVLSGLERALSSNPKVGGGSRTDAVAETLRRTIAIGLKVAVECTLIAADQGKVPADSEVIAVGGTAQGADTVCVVLPANTARYFDLQVREIVAMPRNR